MNEIYNRLKKLIKGLGFSFDDGGITKAEFMAYSKGISMVKEIFDSHMASITLDSDNKNGLLPYCSMLSINASIFDFDTLKNYIRLRMGEKYSFPSAAEFDTAFNMLASGSYRITDGKIQFFGITFDKLNGLGEFIKGYVPFCIDVVFSGNGMTFDEWDTLGKTWNEYDGVNLPFEIIDKLGGDNF